MRRGEEESKTVRGAASGLGYEAALEGSGEPDRQEAEDPREVVRRWRTADTEELVDAADSLRRRVHGNGVLLRGLLEIGNYCRRNCRYCGIRRGNRNVRRYRLGEEEIKQAVREGYARGIRTFVLQAGEDPFWNEHAAARITGWIKEYTAGEAAVTLSLGIKPRKEYAELRSAGADRYLLRFETAAPQLHRYLRAGVPLERRLRALEDLRELGFQLGTGYMVGLPGETEETQEADALLTRRLEADMVGIGPFIPHPDTPLGAALQKPLDLTLRATALVRLLLPRAHLPATTAAGSLAAQGRERCLAAGANVLMPNLTPTRRKKDYLLYPGKICLEESGVACIGCLDLRVRSIGRRLNFSRGDAVPPNRAVPPAFRSSYGELAHTENSPARRGATL